MALRRKEEAMQPTISLLGQRASASIFCSNLVLDSDKLIVLLSGYGPSQEVRAFAQILHDRESPLLEIPDKKSKRVTVGGTVSLIGKMDNGYTGLYILPDPKRRLIVGNCREECFAIYSRILDQQQFVHRDWYLPLFDIAELLTPQIGYKMCYRHIENVSEEVRNRIRYGGFAFPESTAAITVEVMESAAQE
jgi:hypothetical protein